MAVPTENAPATSDTYGGGLTAYEPSVFMPPDRWFHQHFNASQAPAGYLAFHAPRIVNRYGERVEDRARDQIEYPAEDPFIRRKFEGELATRGVTSIMPQVAYEDPSFE